MVDNALITVIRSSISSPLGALAPYKASASTPADIPAMYRTLAAYWSAVREVFPDAWGKPPTESRLMHSAGIQAMGCLMDRIMSRAPGGTDSRRFASEALGRIAPYCCWTRGRWPDIEERGTIFRTSPAIFGCSPINSRVSIMRTPLQRSHDEICLRR